MHPDEEPILRAAFAELHRQTREQAPPFEVMRERALRAANQQRSSSRPAMAPRLAFAMAALCVAALAVWWSGQLTDPGAEKRVAGNSTESVDELITAIEQHVERNEPAASPRFPTDLLLAEHQSDFSE